MHLSITWSHPFRFIRENAPALLMSETPALPPPSGLFPNFDDPSSQKQTLIVINSVVPCVMLAFASLQYYTRIFIIRSVGMDDRKIHVRFNV